MSSKKFVEAEEIKNKIKDLRIACKFNASEEEVQATQETEKVIKEALLNCIDAMPKMEVVESYWIVTGEEYVRTGPNRGCMAQRCHCANCKAAALRVQGRKFLKRCPECDALMLNA